MNKDWRSSTGSGIYKAGSFPTAKSVGPKGPMAKGSTKVNGPTKVDGKWEHGHTGCNVAAINSRKMKK